MSCNCGCGGCQTKNQGPLLTEGKVKSLLSEGLKFHIDKQIPLFESIYRIGSDSHLSMIKEARKLYSRGLIDLNEQDEALMETHLGEFALYEGESVPLDLPMLEEEVNSGDLDNALYRLEKVYKYLDIEYKETRRGEKYIQINYIPVTSPQSQNPEFVNVRYNNDEDLEVIKKRLDLPMLNEGLDEAEFKGKDVPLGKPKRGGSKAYYVYVKDGDKVKKVSFGSGGLRAKIKNKEARNAFAARHKCKDKKDRTKAGYWSCNLPRYAKALGLGANMNTFW